LDESAVILRAKEELKTVREFNLTARRDIDFMSDIL
jgi:hypothetical protein